MLGSLFFPFNLEGPSEGVLKAIAPAFGLLKFAFKKLDGSMLFLYELFLSMVVFDIETELMFSFFILRL
jgi:hypothetical protein